MKKLIIQIPCYNEEDALPATLADLPREVAGFETVEWLVIDDGSSDRTAAVAREHGVDHVVRFQRNRGLSAAFVAGLEASVKAGADVVVNTDADNQYAAADIPKLVAPILAEEAEIVVGARPIEATHHFSSFKKLMQRVGSALTRRISKTQVQDAPSGFRAMSREAAMKLHVFNRYSYTVETIIQAGQKGMAVISVPVSTNEDVRPSRLVKNLWSYMGRQVLTMARIFITYNPFRFFAALGLLIFIVGLLISVRFVYFYFTEGGQGHIQSLILSALLMGTGFFLSVVGVIADLIAVNRILLEGLDWRLQKVEQSVDRRSEKREEAESNSAI